MKYYEQILDLGLFTRKDIEGIIMNKKTADSFLIRSLNNGYIKRVKQNYYVVMDVVNNTPLYNKYLIATKLDKENYISHHSALEYYGLNNQVFNEVTFSGNKRINDFEYEYLNFHFIHSKCDLQIETKIDGVRVTSLERTIIDCIDQIDLAGGIEEIYQALNYIKNLNETKLIEILNYYNKKILFQRSGFILEKFKEKLHISTKTIDYINSRIGSSKCYLNSSIKIADSKFDKKWNICIPNYISKLMNKGCGNIDF